MARLIQVKLVTVSLGIAALLPGAAAQTPAPAASSPILAPSQTQQTPPSSEARRTRPISPGVAAALSAAAPKYTPPPAKAEPKPEVEQPDMREVDKPKNAIIRLPQYIVQEPKSPVFTERSIHTQKGITDIAMRRYISDVDRALNRFTLPLFGSSNEARAMAMYAEDERLKNMSDLRGTAAAIGEVDAGAGTYIRRETDKTFMRTSDFGWSGGPP